MDVVFAVVGFQFTIVAEDEFGVTGVGVGLSAAVEIAVGEGIRVGVAADGEVGDGLFAADVCGGGD